MNANALPEPKIETVVGLLKDVVRREYGSELSVIYVEGGNFKNYQKAIKQAGKSPSVAVWVCLPQIELLRYPYLDVEFNVKRGAKKTGATGPPKKVAELLGLMGGEFPNRN